MKRRERYGPVLIEHLGRCEWSWTYLGNGGRVEGGAYRWRWRAKWDGIQYAIDRAHV